MADTIDITAAGTPGPYRLTGSPTAGLTTGTWGFFVGFAAVALYGPAAKYFLDQMHLGGLALGLLVAAPQLTGSLLRIPFGAWVDRVGGRLPMLTLFGLSLVGMWGLVFILMAPMAESAISPRAYSHCYFPMPLPAGDLPGLTSPGSRSFWSGLRSMSGLRGMLISSNCANKASNLEDSRRIASEKGEELFPNERVWQAIISAAEEPRTWGLVALYFVSFGGFLALTAWFPTYWISLHHMDVKSAAALGGLGFSLLAAIIRVFGGVISERIGGERAAVIAFVAVLAGALLLTFVQEFSLALGGELLIALGMGVGNAAVFKMVPKYVPQAVGGAAGIVGGLGALGGFIIPPFLGAVVDALGTQGYAGGFFRPRRARGDGHRRFCVLLAP